MMERFYFDTKMNISDTGEISGVAWQFGSPDRIGDVIQKGAFSGTRLPLPILFSHDQSDPIGIWTDASEDANGLNVKGALLINEVARAREVHALVKAGAVRGLSIGFISKKSAGRRGVGRTISDLQLMEVSLVTVPMHPGARVTSAKSAVQAIGIAEAINRAAAHFAAR
ncbi:HK97 family phage prohead protease [Rhizobium sp. BK289]|uniref:HK97 family phage prohead protease n=2 Tax=unclassified Rhizobium TaxID=2613769 RepID=UPI001829AA9B|nr:HK97 family phage prohead protease [Rhizobium sp. BK252]MBB3404129.1 HK97 family phage prohead protease [Rhizobium sp. BK289]MBB3417228.1 HK97 family phage prohead protease [Rhizobium sp. BK284]MBB3485105.1 HK97 family phage prohead protease [Rhizobium sp. BK347]